MTTSPEPSSPSAQEPANRSAQESAAAVIAQHPELAVGGAFAGGWLVAMILKHLAP
jgi:hypothetical protein